MNQHFDNPNRSSLQELYRKHAASVYRFAAAQLGTNDADDVVVEVFAIVWKRLQDFDPDRGSEESWLLGIARNQIRRQIRANQKWTRQIGAGRMTFREADHLAPDETDPRSDEVEQAMAKLPQRYREILLLVSVADLPVVDAAGAMGVSEGTGRMLLHRARTRIAELMNQEKSHA